MSCDKCGKPSVYHSKLIVNGVTQTTNLCRDCAIKEGVFTAEPVSIFDDMLSVFSDFLPFEKVADIKCPVCKTTLREYKNTNRLGCPNCYETFRDEINEVLKKITPNIRHKEISNTNINEEKPEKKQRESKQEKISRLKQELALAVKEERYEDAGKLKKKITALESEND